MRESQIEVKRAKGKQRYWEIKRKGERQINRERKRKRKSKRLVNEIRQRYRWLGRESERYVKIEQKMEIPHTGSKIF